jgi:hypothetical protein
MAALARRGAGGERLRVARLLNSDRNGGLLALTGSNAFANLADLAVDLPEMSRTCVVLTKEKTL